jgi:hypothetical protein
MRSLVVAPTAMFRRGVSLVSVTQLNDTIKDSPDAVVIEQKVDSIMPLSSDKSKSVVEQKIYQDMRQIHHIHERNRVKDLEVYYRDDLYSKRPMYGISLPVMKLRKQS